MGAWQFEPTTADGVVAAVADLVNTRAERVRVIIDGAPASAPGELGEAVSLALRDRGSVHVPAEGFWRAASLRLEAGRQDPESWLDAWLDVAALRREVLDDFPATGRVLPVLRDPVTDRSVRCEPVVLPDRGVVVLSGSVLLGRGLPCDVAVHIRLSPAALARRTPPEEHWTLDALAGYSAQRDPEGQADLVVYADDPRHPALARRQPGSGDGHGPRSVTPAS